MFDVPIPLRMTEPTEKLLFWAACQDCEWESDSFSDEDETPITCAECGSNDLAQCRGWV